MRDWNVRSTTGVEMAHRILHLETINKLGKPTLRYLADLRDTDKHALAAEITQLLLRFKIDCSLADAGLLFDSIVNSIRPACPPQSLQAAWEIIDALPHYYEGQCDGFHSR